MTSVSLFSSPSQFDTTASTPAQTTPSQSASGSTSTVAATTATAATSTAIKPDTVQISTQASVLSLKNSGSSVQQIATALGLTTVEVDQELGISTSAQSSQAREVAALLS